MNQPNECKYCGCGVRSRGQFTTFQCWTSLVLDNGWSQSPECKLKGLEDRIQRAVDALKAATRYTVENGHAKTLWWDTNPDGYVTDSKAVDEAIAILEGERDSETWHPYTEPPNDTRSVILRFGANDAEIVVGFHSKDFNAYALSDRNARQLRFVHPTHWRELTQGERDEV